MAPKKRKAAASGGAGTQAVHPDHVVVLNKRLEEIDAAGAHTAAQQHDVCEANNITDSAEHAPPASVAVEERCEAIKAAADEAVAKIMQQLKVQLLQLPKKVRTMPFKDYEAAQQQTGDEGAAAGPSSAAARVDSKLEAAQQQSVAAATAAPTTRSLRSRARSATAAAAAEPRTTRSTRSRQAVAAAAAPALEPVAPAAADGDASKEQPPLLAQLQTLAGVDSPAQPQPPPAAAAASRAPAAADEARRAAAQAKVDAKLAALGVAAAGTAARGADRTVLRQPKPGETFFSKNGSPLSIHPNVTRHRGRTMAAPLMTPAMQAAAPAGSSMLGCITLIKKQTAATGLAAAAAATGRSKRSRAAVAAVPEEQEAADGDATAIMVTTDDGSAFTVDAATGGVEGVPARYRGEVAAKLKAIQALAAAALGGGGGGGGGSRV